MPIFCFLAPVAPPSKTAGPVRAVWRVKAEDWQSEAILGVRFGLMSARSQEMMITAGWTWTDIRNFEENPSGYQRAQLAWMLVLAAALVLVTALLG